MLATELWRSARETPRARAALEGAIAGVDGAAGMSILRLAARQAGWIDEAAPHAVEQWAAHRAGAWSASGPGHRVLGEVLHLGMGLAAGAVYGVLVRQAGRPSIAGGLMFGLAVWTVAFAAVNPLLGIARPPWRARPVENAVNIVSHLLFGAATAVIVGEFERSPSAGLGSARRRRRVG